MITAFVQFPLGKVITREEARDIFRSTAEKYLNIEGLISKQYILSEDGSVAGGIYLWRSREDAERLYTDGWKDFVRNKYGVFPTIQFFHSPVVVDNAGGRILDDGVITGSVV